MGSALQPPLLGLSVRLTVGLRRRSADARASLASEFLAPFYVFAASTMGVATVLVWLRWHNPILATALLGFTLLYAITMVAAFHARANGRKAARG